MVNLLTVAPLGTGKTYLASSLRSVWLRKFCSTRVTATWSSMVMVTLWFSIARGGTVFSSGMSSPWAWTVPAQASSTARIGKKRRISGSFRERGIVHSAVIQTNRPLFWICGQRQPTTFVEKQTLFTIGEGGAGQPGSADAPGMEPLRHRALQRQGRAARRAECIVVRVGAACDRPRTAEFRQGRVSTAGRLECHASPTSAPWSTAPTGPRTCTSASGRDVAARYRRSQRLDGRPPFIAPVSARRQQHTRVRTTPPTPTPCPYRL